MSKKAILTLIYILSVILLIIRVDFWWWGTKIHPIIAGWLTLPMLYQFGIWIAGSVLLYGICFFVWTEEETEEEVRK